MYEINSSEADTMINIIYGEKGTGKTKIIIDRVNEAVKTAKGNVVFISQKKSCSVNIDFNVRCVYTEDYAVSSVAGITGFIDGLMAGNTDIEHVFLDGAMRIADCGLEELKDFFAEAERLSSVYGVNFTFTLSCTKEALPDFIAKYVA